MNVLVVKYLYNCIYIFSYVSETSTKTSEVTSEHPEVQAIVEKMIEVALQSPITLPPEKYTDVLEETFTEVKAFIGKA